MSFLLSPFDIRGVRFKNRIAVSPMSQYRAEDGLANAWHLVHLGRFALGGAALVYAEATAVERRGLRTAGDLGLWKDAQIDGLIPITTFLAQEGAVPGIQLSHAGRKASERRPWHGDAPLDNTDIIERGEAPWDTIAPSAIPFADGWPTPIEMSEAEIEKVILAFGNAARRSYEAGFKIIEVYAAHGFLIHQFLSPISNQRQDKWGGSPQNRRRFAVEVASAIREHWPAELPLAFRLSATDWLPGGIEMEDTVATAQALKSAGVDIIDCSTGGIGGKERPKRMVIEQGYQVSFAQRVREEADVATMAVGLLWDAAECDRIIGTQKADMIALARELLEDPNWPLHAANELGLNDNHELWPEEFGWWLMKRKRLLTKLGIQR